MKSTAKRLIVASSVVGAGLLVFWLSGTPWVRGTNAAFTAFETLLALGASMAIPIYKDKEKTL